MLEKIKAANNEKWTYVPIRESGKTFLSEFFTHEIRPEGKFGCLAITSEMNAQRIVEAINATQLTTEQVKLPEKLDLNKKCRMYDHKIGHMKNAIYVAPIGAVLETELIINQLIDFCESLQARVKELENEK